MKLRYVILIVLSLLFVIFVLSMLLYIAFGIFFVIFLVEAIIKGIFHNLSMLIDDFGVTGRTYDE